MGKTAVELNLSKKELEYLIELTDLVGGQEAVDPEMVNYLQGWLKKYNKGGKYTQAEYRKYCDEMGVRI